MVDKNNLRKDFEVFSKGVERLEELRSQLDSLDTSKFQKEEASIRSKLKNVSAIPQIEVELNALKKKISGKVSVKPKPVVCKSKKENPLEEKIKKLEKQVEIKKDSEKRDAKISKDVKILEKELESLKAQARKQKEEEKRKTEILKRIDPSVDFTVNELFGMSLNEIKAELSSRIKNKETQMQKELEEDLKSREDLFKIKYKDIESKFNKKYSKRVESKLNKEVSKKFDKILNQRLKEKKIVLSKEELASLRQKAQKEFDSQKKDLLTKMDSNVKSVKDNLKKHFEEELLLQKHTLHQRFEQDVSSEVSRLNDDYKTKKSLLEKEFGKKSKELEFRLNVMKAELEEKKKILREKQEAENKKLSEQRSLLKRLRDKVLRKSEAQKKKEIEELKRMRNDLRKQEEADAQNHLFKLEKELKQKCDLEYKERVSKLEKAKHAEVEKRVNKKVEAIRAGIKKEFEDKLNEEVQQKRKEFEEQNMKFAEDFKTKALELFK